MMVVSDVLRFFLMFLGFRTCSLCIPISGLLYKASLGLLNMFIHASVAMNPYLAVLLRVVAETW